MVTGSEAEKTNIVDDVGETYGLDVSKAEELVEIAVREATPIGSGQTVSELAVSSGSEKAFGTIETRRQFGLSKREFLKIGAAVGVVTGLVTTVGGLIIEDVYEHAKGRVADWRDKFYFSRPFIKNYIYLRKYSDLVANIPPGECEEAKRLVDLFGLFTGANSAPSYLTPDQENELLALLDRAGDESTKLVIADLLAAQYVRLGLGHDAARLLSAIESDKIVESDEGLLLTNQRLSVAYTTLDRGLALRPGTWEFSQAIEGLDLDWLTSETGIRFSDLRSGSVIDITSAVRVPTNGPLAGPLGFYVINWLLLNWVAAQDEQVRRDAARQHLQVLREFSSQSDLARQVWNFSFIAGLQLHRFGIASEDRHGDFLMRDQYFSVCLGQAEGFGSVTSDRLMNLRVDDPVPVCMAVLLRSDPNIDKRGFDGKVAPIGRIATLSGAVRSLSVRRAADQFRDLGRVQLTDGEAWNTYAGDDGTLSIYTDHPSNIRSSIISSQN